MNKSFRVLLIASAVLIADGASATDLAVYRGAHHAAHLAARNAAIDKCQFYGFVRGTRNYAECRMDVRRYWTTGPCGSAGFGAIHRDYCHLNPPPFI